MRKRLEFAEGYNYIPGTKTGWLFTDTIIFVECPKCNSLPFELCTTPTGRPAKNPHSLRVNDYVRRSDFKPEDYQRPLFAIEDVIRESGGTADTAGLEPAGGKTL